MARGDVNRVRHAKIPECAKTDPIPKTDKMQDFCRQYIIDLCGKDAAIRAGYAPKYANRFAYRLLARPDVQRYITQLRKESMRRVKVDADRVIRELAKLGFANMQDYITIDEDGNPHINLKGLKRSKAAAIQEITVDEYMDGRAEEARPVKRTRFKLHDKRGPLEDLGKNLGIFEKDNEQQKQSPPVININVPSDGK